MSVNSGRIVSAHTASLQEFHSRSHGLQGEKAGHQLGLFFFAKSDADALIERVSSVQYCAGKGWEQQNFESN